MVISLKIIFAIMVGVISFAETAIAQDNSVSRTGNCNIIVQGGSNNTVTLGSCVPDVDTAYKQCMSQGKAHCLSSAPASSPEKRSVQDLFFDADKLLKEKRYAEAVPILESASRLGEIDSQVALGILYTSGLAGIPWNPERAFELFNLAANQGNPVAIGRIALCYLKGEGIKQDIAAAIRYTELGIKRGDALSIDTMGYLIENGIGEVKADPCESVRYYQKSADLGSSAGKVSLAASYLRGSCVPKNNKLAHNLLAEAAAMGNPDAAAGLLLMHDKGLD